MRENEEGEKKTDLKGDIKTIKGKCQLLFVMDKKMWTLLIPIIQFLFKAIFNDRKYYQWKINP